MDAFRYVRFRDVLSPDSNRTTLVRHWHGTDKCELTLRRITEIARVQFTINLNHSVIQNLCKTCATNKVSLNKRNTVEKQKSSIFREISPCSPLKIKRFGGTCRLHLRPWSRHVRSTFNLLHGVISRKTELFITTAGRTSNATKKQKINKQLLKLRGKLDVNK
jgi:hypothetical protein